MVITHRLHFKLFPDLLRVLIIFVQNSTIIQLKVEFFLWRLSYFITRFNAIHVTIWVHTLS